MERPSASPTFLRLLGLVLIALSVLPFHRLAPPAAPGTPTEHLNSLAGSYYGALVVGAIIIAVLAIPLGFTRIPRRVEAALGGRVRRALLAPGPWRFSIAAGAASGLLALVLSRYAFSFRPALLDATSQLVHARYLAEGRLAGPELPLPEFFTFQYMIADASGWVSQYPPGHAALLAIGFALGAPWVVAPALAALAVTFTGRLAEELLPRDRLAARLGTLFLGFSLFFLGHAAGYMNHATAAAFGALAVLGGVRAVESGKRADLSAALSGAATGAAFAVRPLAGVIVGAVALRAMILAEPGGSAVARSKLRGRRFALFAAGGLPPIAALAAYNQHFFGHPARFGYLAAEGPGHGFGFHRDPWGRMYTPLDGLVQASRDLLALGLDLVVTPVSLVVLVGIFLLVAPSRARRLSLLLAWALLPSAAYFFYWHQDLFMGPRLLTEFAPPWAILAAAALLELSRRTRSRCPARPRGFDLHGTVVAAAVISAALAILLLIPQRVAMYRSQWGPSARTPVPAVAEPSLVFIHGSWSDRLGARLAGHGLRVDSVRAALRYNTSCELQEWLDAADSPARSRFSAAGRSAEDRVGAIDLNFQPRPAGPVTEVTLEDGRRIRTSPDEETAATCVEQANSDRLGRIEMPDLAWRGDLPGLGAKGSMFVRDMGPELNARLLERYPRRRPLIYLRPGRAELPVLLPYETGMDLLWNGPGVGFGSPSTPAGP